MIVENIIKDTDTFGKHNNFESRSKSITDMIHYSEAIAVVENNDDYSQVYYFILFEFLIRML